MTLGSISAAAHKQLQYDGVQYRYYNNLLNLKWQGERQNPLVEIVVSKIAVFVVAKSKIWPVVLVGSLS